MLLKEHLVFVLLLFSSHWHIILGIVCVCWLIVVLAESGRLLLHSQGTCGATSALRLVFSHKVALPYHKVVVHHRFNIPSIRTLMLHHRPCLWLQPNLMDLVHRKIPSGPVLISAWARWWVAAHHWQALVVGPPSLCGDTGPYLATAAPKDCDWWERGDERWMERKGLWLMRRRRRGIASSGRWLDPVLTYLGQLEPHAVYLLLTPRL